MASIRFDKIGKSFGETEIIKNLDFSVKDGEFMVFVGPSGCGKSTVLRMIAGLETISTGELWIGNRVVNDIHPKDRDIAMVFQTYALYPHMNVYDNIAFGLKIRKLPDADIRKRVQDAADLLGLDKLLDRKPKALSGGQRQRVALGRAIVRNPTVFLFDEPLSNLDGKMRVQMRSELSRLKGGLGDVMRDGLIMQVADPLTLYRQPQNLFVAGFIGSPPMNLLKGKVQQREGGLF